MSTLSISRGPVSHRLANGKLCQNCQRSFGRDFKRPKTEDPWLGRSFRLHHPNTQSLQKAFHDRCRFCVEAWKEFSVLPDDSSVQVMTIIGDDGRFETANQTGQWGEMKHLGIWFLYNAQDADVYGGAEIVPPILVEHCGHSVS
jgi:hypothetical protein